MDQELTLNKRKLENPRDFHSKLFIFSMKKRDNYPFSLQKFHLFCEYHIQLFISFKLERLEKLFGARKKFKDSLCFFLLSSCIKKNQLFKSE